MCRFSNVCSFVGFSSFYHICILARLQYKWNEVFVSSLSKLRNDRIFVLHAWFSCVGLDPMFNFISISQISLIAWNMVNFMGFAWILVLVLLCIPFLHDQCVHEEEKKWWRKLIFHLEKLCRKLKNHLSSSARHIRHRKQTRKLDENKPTKKKNQKDYEKKTKSEDKSSNACRFFH